MALLLNVLLILGYGAVVNGQGAGVGSQSQYIMLRTINVNVIPVVAAYAGAALGQSRQEEADEVPTATATYTGSLPNAANGCPTGWHLYMESCYLLTDTPHNWWDHKQICKDLGASLAEIQSAAELTELKNSILAAAFAANQPVFTGLNDHIQEGNFRYDISDDEAEYLNFFVGLNGDFGPSSGECGMVFDDFMLMLGCNQGFFGLCERKKGSILTYSGI